MSSLEDIFFKTCMRQQTNKLFTASFPFLILPFQFFFHSIAVFTDFRPIYSDLSLIDDLSLPGIEPGTTTWQSSAIPARCTPL
jgi:hypothetical protein